MARFMLRTGLAGAVTSTLLLLVLLLQVPASASPSWETIPSWVEVFKSENIIFIKIKPSYYLDDGTPVIVVSDYEEVIQLAQYGVEFIIIYSFNLVGGYGSKVDFVYDGPGRILEAHVSPNGDLLLLAIGDVDVRLVTVDNGAGVEEFDRVVVVAFDFTSNICSPELNDELSTVKDETFLDEVIVNVVCFPPVVSVDKTRLEELGYRPEDVVDLLKGAGVDNFYLFLVEDYIEALEEYGPRFPEPGDGDGAGDYTETTESTQSMVGGAGVDTSSGLDAEGDDNGWKVWVVAAGLVGIILVVLIVVRK